MKTLIAASIVTLFPVLAFASFDQNLAYGASGGDVYQLQDILIEDGCLAHSSTGYFGLLTLHAVQCFQANHGVTATGYVGPLTRAALNDILTPIVTASAAAIEDVATTTTSTVPSSSPVVSPVIQSTLTAVPMQNTTISASPSTFSPSAVDIKNTTGADTSLAALNYQFSSTDFPQTDLNAIQVGAQKVVDGAYADGNSIPANSDVTFKGKFSNLPIGAGKIKATLVSVTIGEVTTNVSGQPFYLTNIMKYDDGRFGYSESPAWVVDGTANPN